MRSGLVCWFTGLSGAGKTTVAARVEALLRDHGYSTIVVDGDDVRKDRHEDLGFGEHDVRENNRRIADLCQRLRGNYDVVLVAIISPFADARQSARRALGRDFYEVYFAADLDTVVRRDVKGLYARAARGEIRNMIGYSPGYAYEPPTSPDVTIDSTTESVEGSAARLFDFLRLRLIPDTHQEGSRQ